MKLTTAKKICKRLSCQYGIIKTPELIPMPYSHKGKCVALGYYDNERNTVEINKYALELWDSERIQEIIQHELVHTRCYQDFWHGGHGEQFQILAELMGVPEHVRIAVKKVE